MTEVGYVTRAAAAAAAALAALALAGCASNRPPSRDGDQSGTGGSRASGSGVPAEVTVNVRLGAPQPPVRVRVGGRVIAYLPPNPIGRWAAPRTDAPSVLAVSASSTAAGTTVVISARAAGRGVVTSPTTPSGDPVHGAPGPTWRLEVVVG